jgi:hypothetical protein
MAKTIDKMSIPSNIQAGTPWVFATEASKMVRRSGRWNATRRTMTTQVMALQYYPQDWFSRLQTTKYQYFPACPTL